MNRDQSYTLTEKQYDYLLPIFGICAPGVTKLLHRQNRYFFIGTYEEYMDALNRCKYLND